MGNDSGARDEDLDAVHRCLGGDDGAFEELVLRHQKRMLNIAYRITGSYDDACETVQDAFLSAYRNLREFRGSSAFSTWLHAITVNASRNRLQQMRTRSLREPASVDDPVETVDGKMNREAASPDPSPVDQLEKRERDRKIQECMNALDPGFRAVIVLRDVQGFSYREIGDMLRMAEGTVKSRLARARESVRNCLKRSWGSI